MNLQRGMRDKLSNYINTDSEFCIELHASGPAVYDFCCFGIDKLGKLSDDRYMIFYNQTVSPDNAIRLILENGNASFNIQLPKLPSTIEKLVFTASIDGGGVMGEIFSHNIALHQNNTIEISMQLSGSDFKQEKAIISMEIYRKDEWRIAGVAKGFNGGLSALLAAYGGTEIFSEPPNAEFTNIPSASMPSCNSTSANISSVSTDSCSSMFSAHEKAEDELTQRIMGKISLSKDKANLEKHVVNLSKCVVSLSNENGVNLGSAQAKVVVVLDYSWSMKNLYANGTVQHTINRLVPLGLTFDDNGSIDVYLFETYYKKMADLMLSNYEDYVYNTIFTSGYSMGGTNYAPVLKAIIKCNMNEQGGLFGFGKKTVKTNAIADDEKPIFILFITDGENMDKKETDKIILKSSEMNVFIQFIGIGNYRFQYLQKLDEIPGRVRDNTGFSNMKDLETADDSELYMNVLKQFSYWLKGQQ